MFFVHKTPIGKTYMIYIGGLVIAANILALVRSPGHILTITNT